MAAVAGWIVAISMAPTGDEFHTLAYLREPSLTGVWHAYREVGDTLPPLWYWLSWLSSQVVGDGILGARLIAIVSWALAAGVLARILAPWGRLPSVAGALLPTASTMVFIGVWARPYATAFLAVTVAVWAWLQLEREHAGRHLVCLAAASAVAVSLHYVALAAVLALVAAEFLTYRPEGRRRVAILGALGCGLLPIVVALPLLPDAVSNQSRIPSDAGPLQVVAFYWSVGRPVLGPALLLAFVLAAIVVVRRSTDQVVIRLEPEEIVGLCLGLLVPVMAVAGMALTSGVYWHRYALPALAGAGLVVGCGAGRLAAVDRRLGMLLAAVTLIGVAAAPSAVAADHARRVDVERLPERLGIDRTDEPVLVADPYTFELLAERSPGASSALVSPSPYAGRRDSLAADDLRGGGSVVIVGRATAVDAALSGADRSCDRVLGEAVLVVTGERRRFVACSSGP